MVPEQLGPYRIGKRLGRGGMGTVYVGENVETGEPAAIKILSATLAHEEGFRDRFQSEIETLKKLRHPNIVRLFGYGEQDELSFFAMELVDGGSLEEELRNNQRFSWREVVLIALQTCLALRHAHDRGVVHRDIKPANLMTTSEGQLKLSDFGIAKLFGATSATTHGSVLGTAEYMAPEQADGRPVTYRADLYSLGGVMYALLAGRPPFQAKSVAEMLQLQRFAEPDPVRRYASDVPEEIETIVAQLLAKSPEQRIPNALVLSRRLEAALQEVSARKEAAVSASEPGVTQIAGSAARPSEDDASIRTAKTRSPEGKAAPAAPDAGTDDVAAAGASAPVSGAVDDSRLPTQVAAEGREVAVAELAEAETRPKRRRFDHFTHVRDEDLDEDLISREATSPVSLQTFALVAALVVLGAGAWYSLQRPSANALYSRVLATVEKGDDSLLDAEQDVRDFLAYHPNDSRTREFEALLEEIQLRRFERKYERSLRLSASTPLAPVERAYTDALQLAETDPVRAKKMFQAIRELFYTEQFMSSDTHYCLLLAARQIKKIDARLADDAARYGPLLEKQIREVHKLGQHDPVAGRTKFQSIVDLYGDEAWADPLIEQAREQMTWLHESEASEASRGTRGDTSSFAAIHGVVTDEAGDSPKANESSDSSGDKNGPASDDTPPPQDRKQSSPQVEESSPETAVSAGENGTKTVAEE